MGQSLALVFARVLMGAGVALAVAGWVMLLRYRISCSPLFVASLWLNAASIALTAFWALGRFP